MFCGQLLSVLFLPMIIMIRRVLDGSFSRVCMYGCHLQNLGSILYNTIHLLVKRFNILVLHICVVCRYAIVQDTYIMCVLFTDTI